MFVIGAANADLSGHAAMPLRPGDSTPGRVHWAPGGVARNVAVRLAALQPARAVKLVCTVGDDAWGRQLRAATQAAGVDVSGCRRVRGMATSVYLSLHGPDGELLAAVNHMAVQDRLDVAQLRRHAAGLRAAAAWFIDANLGPDALAWLSRQRPAGLPLFADAVSVAKCERLRPLLPGLHTLKVDRDEAVGLAGRPVRSVRQAETAARLLLRAGPAQVAVSLGAQGLVLARKGRDGACVVHHQPGLAARVLSVTGAGDAMMAALVHAHLQGWPQARAAAFAVAAATCVLEAPADAPAASAPTIWRRARRAATAPENA